MTDLWHNETIRHPVNKGSDVMKDIIRLYRRTVESRHFDTHIRCVSRNKTPIEYMYGILISRMRY
jgi:hypothetical protein